MSICSHLQSLLHPQEQTPAATYILRPLYHPGDDSLTHFTFRISLLRAYNLFSPNTSTTSHRCSLPAHMGFARAVFGSTAYTRRDSMLSGGVPPSIYSISSAWTSDLRTTPTLNSATKAWSKALMESFAAPGYGFSSLSNWTKNAVWSLKFLSPHTMTWVWGRLQIWTSGNIFRSKHPDVTAEDFVNQNPENPVLIVQEAKRLRSLHGQRWLGSIPRFPRGRLTAAR